MRYIAHLVTLLIRNNLRLGVLVVPFARIVPYPNPGPIFNRSSLRSPGARCHAEITTACYKKLSQCRPVRASYNVAASDRSVCPLVSN